MAGSLVNSARHGIASSQVDDLSLRLFYFFTPAPVSFPLPNLISFPRQMAAEGNNAACENYSAAAGFAREELLESGRSLDMARVDLA